MSETLKDFCRICLSPKGSCHHVHQDSSKESFMFNKDVTIDEQRKEITKLKKALELANQSLAHIETHGRTDRGHYATKYASEAQKQIKEIMRG